MAIGQLPWHTHVCWFVCLFVDLVGGSFGYNSLSQPNGDLKWWWFRQMCSLFGQTIIKLSQWPNATRKHQTFPMNCSFYRTLYTHARTPSSNVYTVAKVASYFHRKTKTKSSEHNQMHIHTTPYVGVCVCVCVERDCFYCFTYFMVAAAPFVIILRWDFRSVCAFGVFVSMLKTVPWMWSL